MCNTLEQLDKTQHSIPFWVSTCPGFEYITKRELTSSRQVDDLLDALSLDAKRFQYGRDLLRGKFAFVARTDGSVKSGDGSCSHALRTISGLKSVEYASVLVSFVQGAHEKSSDGKGGFQANTDTFIPDLECLDDDGPAGSLAAWHRAPPSSSS